MTWSSFLRMTSVQLVDLIGQPVILLLHSGLATSGWLLADARPKLVKGIIAAEPWGPPIENAELDARGPGHIWGLTNFPIHYDPPIKEASELQTVRQDKADGPDLDPLLGSEGARAQTRKPAKLSRSSMCPERRVITVRTPIA